MMSRHKQWVSEIFDRAASNYGTKSSSFFSTFGKRLSEQVNVPPGSHVLDIATGRGAVLFPLAQKVGSSGRLAGIDISREMLKNTAEEARVKNLSWIELEHMDAEELSFEAESFDFVFCGFALFFFPSIPRALAEFKRVLKPGGKLIASTWGNDSELDAWLNAEIEKISKAKSLAATPLWTATDLLHVLKEASFQDIEIIEETKIFTHDSAEKWWESLWNHVTRAKLEQLSSAHVNHLKRAALEKTQKLSQGNGIEEPLQVFYGIAAKCTTEKKC